MFLRILCQNQRQTEPVAGRENQPFCFVWYVYSYVPYAAAENGEWI
jgi:hypothetical protein